MGNWTAAALWDFQVREGSEAYEIDAGDLLEMTPTNILHGDIEAEIGTRLRLYLREYPLGRVFTGEVGFQLDASTVRAADVAFLSKERLKKTPVDTEGFYPGAPELVVEVLSPRDRASEILHKIQLWLRFGSRLVWVVDPKRRTVAVYRLNGTNALLMDSQILTGEDVLPGFECVVSELFPKDEEG